MYRSEVNRISRPLIGFAVFILLTVGLVPAWAQTDLGLYDSVPPTELPSDLAFEWIETIYARVRDERLNPPEAARIYGYMGVTLYESVVPGWPENRSLSGQLNGLGVLPAPENAPYDWLTVMNAALRTVMVDLMLERGPDNTAIFNALYDSQLAQRASAVAADVLARSADYGEEIGKAITRWASQDGYAELPPVEDYIIPDYAPRAWVLTTPNTQPVEPYWGTLRTFLLDYSRQCHIYSTMLFDTDPDSTFYQQALEVMRTVDTLTPEQRDIALWWMDDPGDTGLPSGHWVLIATYVLRDTIDRDQPDLGAPLLLTAEVMGMLGPVVADTFIAVWDLKYETFLLRPVTYINRYINSRWQPLIETPYFPEYPSAHSAVSAAAAEILEFFFGTRHFTDRANESRQMGVRSYLSFEHAAREAGFSRLYGGIHYREGIEQGLAMGECIGQRALNETIMRPYQQG
jgi:hypothetical protein